MQMRYYRVLAKSPEYQKIKDVMRQIDKVVAARKAFMRRLFVDPSKTNRVVYSRPNDWGVQILRKHYDPQMLPAGFYVPKRYDMAQYVIAVPDKKTSIGRAHDKTMRSPKYVQPDNDAITDILKLGLMLSGCKIYRPGTQELKDGTLIVTLPEFQKPPACCRRISDVAYEKLQ